MFGTAPSTAPAARAREGEMAAGIAEMQELLSIARKKGYDKGRQEGFAEAREMAGGRLQRLHEKLMNVPLTQEREVVGVRAEVGYALDDVRALQPPRDKGDNNGKS